MSADGPHNDWVRPVIDFLDDSLPPFAHEGRTGWEHMYSSAWQFGVMALDALGQGEEVAWGAWRSDTPRVPDALPRWDDICTVVLSVLAQRKEIAYRNFDGTQFVPPAKPGQFTIRPIYPKGQEPQVPEPNVAAAHGCGPARVLPQHLSVLEALGLVENGAWAARAQTVLWRKRPRAWDLDLTSHVQFEDGLDRCLQNMPDDVVETLHDLVEITPDDITMAVERQKVANADLIAKYPAQAKFDRPVAREGMFRSLVFRAKNQMNDLFFAGWRLADGWLSASDQDRALPIFHDPLAIAMRAASLEQMTLSFPQEMRQ